MRENMFLPGQMNSIDSFVIDAENPEGWIKKAITTATYHEISMYDTNIMDYFVKAKNQMKEDRKAGLHLW